MKGLFLELLLIAYRSFVQSMNFKTEAHMYVCTKLKTFSSESYTITLFTI